MNRSYLWIGALVWIALPAWLFAAPPMMDSELLGNYRSAPPNLVQDGRFQEAIGREQDALRLAQEQFGDLHPLLAPILDDLASLERIAGLYGPSEKDYRWALALREKNYGLDSEAVALSLRHLAALCADLGRSNEALLDIQKAYAILEKTSDRSQKAQCLLEWGLLEREAGDPKDAEAHLKASLEAKTEDLPAWRIEEELARVLLAQGKNEEAQAMGETALQDRQKAFAPDSPEVGRSLHFLGEIHQRTGSGKAVGYFEAAEKIRDRMIGPDLFTNIPYLQEAAETDISLGKFKESEPLFQRVLALTKKYYGPAHPRTAFILERLATVEAGLGSKGKAAEALREAKKILEKGLSKDHPATVHVIQALSKLTEN
jgi:tetratricopeptide (TPR) repeat protein